MRGLTEGKFLSVENTDGLLVFFVAFECFNMSFETQIQG